jgi:hypothetical protein
MGIFSRNTTKAVPPQAVQAENKEVQCFRSINTEGMDLSQPFVDDYFSRGYSWVFFGENNLYPQILNQLYISAPMHQACCNFKKYSLIGNGYEWEGYKSMSVEEKIQIKQFETMSKLKANKGRIVLDWVKHGRVIALLHFSAEHNRYTHFKLVDPESIRNNHVDLFRDNPTAYFYSRDWTLSSAQMQFTPYSPTNKDEWQVLELKNEIGGFKSYGMPDWVSSANWQKVGADIALLHKSAIENGIQPSVVYRYPYIMSPDERSQWENGMRANAKGAKNYGRSMKVEANSKELLPEIDVVETTDNHALFEQTSKEYKEEVAISHGVDPMLMGVRVAGSLGAQDEKEFSAEQFKKIWVNENREIIEDFMNELARICGIKANLIINETDILTVKEMMEGGEAVTTTDNGEPVSTDKEADARAQLKGSVGGVQGIIGIQTAVAQGVTDRGSAIALLELIYGFSNTEASSLLGSVEEGDLSAPTTPGQQSAPKAQTEQFQDNGNEALRGLSAKENQDMMRIVRDYSKGRLNEEIAKARLMAYGIDEVTITKILNA